MVTPTNRKTASKIRLSALAVLFLSACASAHETPDAQSRTPATGPAIWTLSDADTTIHLFGYTQVLKPNTQWQSETYKQTFTEANIVVLETDSSSPEAQSEAQQTIQKIGLFTDGRTLSSVLTEDQQAEVNILTTSLGAPLTALNPLKPWLAAIQIGVLNISRQGYDLANTPSSVIAREAKAAGKDVRVLEGPTVLMQHIAKLPEAEHVGMLMHGVRTLRDRPDQTEKLNSAWVEWGCDHHRRNPPWRRSLGEWCPL